MREQQQFMARTAELQRQMAATLQQQQQQQATVSQQQQPSDSTAHDTREYRAEGIAMPKFSEMKDDNVGDYMFSAKLYFKSKNIKFGADAPQQRPLSLLVANLKGPAAAWYREYVSHDGNYLQSVTQFEELLTSEFTAPDRQEHLRDQLLRLWQTNFGCLEDYVAAFRSIICKIEDMSDIDKVMHFQKELVVEIRQEVKLSQFRSTTEAISFALMYDRTHNVGSRGQSKEQANHRAQGQRRFQHPQSPVEEPTPMEIDSSRFVFRDECLRKNLCFYWKEPGHRLADCRKRQTRNTARGFARPAPGQTSFRTNQSTFRRVVEEDADEEEEDDDVEVLQSMQLNMTSVQAPQPESRGLLRFDGSMNGQSVRILIESGAEQNIVRPGLAQHCVEAAKFSAESFDGTTTPARTAQRCVKTLSFAGRDFADVSLIEWEVSVNQDVILGHPWLAQFNPSIDWQAGVMRFQKPRVVRDYRSVNDSLEVELTVGSAGLRPEFIQYSLPSNLQQQLDGTVKAGYFHMPLGPSSISAFSCQPLPNAQERRNDDDDNVPLCVLSAAQFATKVAANEYAKLYHVAVKTSPKVKTVPPELQVVLKAFADVFPNELPSQLPPHRSIEHEVILKPGAKPSNCAPIRLSKVEQEAIITPSRPMKSPRHGIF
ncbi:hypothetical protein PI124_g5075 [Phytophthora idaei]|nr:hypothetical protein PI125_g7448 [Phytophthora idaei]KAG3151511.1 hypothetical protein PI126_g10969 [Phytophthora idaei]KAG3250288.1 hypothetical protein PI124_g5075 [Phytophthora idaei]